MKEPFELEWCGGVAEKHFRRLRPDVADLPWGTIQKERYPLELVERARVWWTESAVAEYRAALSFSALLRSMLEAKVPLDIVGMASDFVADEIAHVEVASRLAMELGGGAPLEIDTTALLPRESPGLTPIERVNEHVLSLSCIHETLSGAIVTSTMRVASDPLMRAAETLIARDEAQHIRLGSVYFEWVKERLSDAERMRLTTYAIETLLDLSQSWKESVPAAAGGFEVEQLHDFGRLDAGAFIELSTRCLREQIVPNLARFGIEIPSDAVERIVA